MATVYKIEIELVSPWSSFSEEFVKQKLEKKIKEGELFGKVQAKVKVKIIA